MQPVLGVGAGLRHKPVWKIMFEGLEEKSITRTSCCMVVESEDACRVTSASLLLAWVQGCCCTSSP